MSEAAPPSGDDDRLRRRLGDLRVLVADAAHLTSKGWGAYVADTPDGRLLRAAGEHLIIQVATVAEKLPQEFKDRYPAAEWVKLGRMRNLAAHHCDLVGGIVKTCGSACHAALASSPDWSGRSTSLPLLNFAPARPASRVPW